MATLREQAHELVNKYSIDTCFSFLERHLKDNDLRSKLKLEFIAGESTFDFSQRLHVLIDELIDAKTAGDKNFAKFIAKEVPTIEDYARINQRNENNQYLDTDKVLADKSSEHLNKKTLQAFFAKERTKIVLGQNSKAITQQEKLRRLTLADNGHIYKGTLLSFGEYAEVNKVCLSASQSKFAYFRGIERKNSIPIQTEIIYGNLLQQYERMIKLLQENIPLERNRALDKDEFEVPIEALSELVANAYVHRDYSAKATQIVSVEIFDDRIEIKNAGKIPDNVDVYDVQESILQNPTIMSIFYMSGFVERMGTGINKARLAFQEKGLQDIVFKIEPNEVLKVIVYRNKATAYPTMQAYEQKALDALTKTDYAKVFALLKEANVMNYSLNALKNKFEIEGIDVLFVQRLEVAIKEAFTHSLTHSLAPTTHFLTHSFTQSPAHFIGRQAELRLLHAHLQAGKRTVLVNGVGGVGKTTLAQKYAHDYQANYAHILWIRQNGDLWASFVQTDLLDALHLAYDNQTDRQVLFTQVLQKLKELPATNLLLIDNYEPTENDQTQDTLGQLFALPAHWRVVCTSRVDVPIFDKTLRLDVLPAHEAIQVFKQHAVGKPQDDAEINALLLMVGYHTLMTELLAKTYLRCIQFGTVGKMHAFLQEKGLQNLYLEKKIYIEMQSTYLYAYLRKVFSLASLTEDEVWLLKQWAVLPTAPHQASDFLTWIQDTDLAYENTLLALAEKGWLQTEDYLAYALHPFLQLFLREELKPTLPDCEKMYNYFVDLMEMDKVQANPLAHQYLIPIGEAIVQNIGFTVHEDKKALFWIRIYNIYTFLGDYSNAARCVEESLVIYEITVGKQSEEYANSLGCLAYLRYHQSNYTESLALYQDVLQIREIVLGKKHRDYATTLNNLGFVHNKQGNYTEAEPLFVEALQIRKAVLGEHDPYYAQSLNNLALLYNKQGNYVKALPLFQKALQIYQAQPSEQHSFYAQCLHNTGTLYFGQSNYEEARSYFEKAYDIFFKKLGEQHPYTQDTKAWLDKLPHTAE